LQSITKKKGILECFSKNWCPKYFFRLRLPLFFCPNHFPPFPSKLANKALGNDLLTIYLPNKEIWFFFLISFYVLISFSFVCMKKDYELDDADEEKWEKK